MNPRQIALVRFMQETLNARTGEPTYKTFYDLEVQETFVMQSI